MLNVEFESVIICVHAMLGFQKDIVSINLDEFIWKFLLFVFPFSFLDIMANMVTI